jgi:hypothetical protein
LATMWYSNDHYIVSSARFCFHYIILLML